MELGVLWKNPSLRVSSCSRSAHCPQPSVVEGRGQGPLGLLCLRADPLWRSPSEPAQARQATSDRQSQRKHPALPSSRGAARETLLMNGIFFAFLQWIKQHTGTPLPVHQKGLYRRGDYTHTLSSLLIHRTTSSARRADKPTWFWLQGCNFSSRRLLFAWQTTLFSSGQIWINKHYVFSWGQRAWFNESENPKKRLSTLRPSVTGQLLKGRLQGKQMAWVLIGWAFWTRAEAGAAGCVFWHGEPPRNGRQSCRMVRDSGLRTDRCLQFLGMNAG